MSSNDHIRVARELRLALQGGYSFTLPSMLMSDFAQVLAHLKG